MTMEKNPLSDDGRGPLEQEVHGVSAVYIYRENLS